ncbi:GntR family transcriptional regulator [Spirillospora sp. NPDC047418]
MGHISDGPVPKYAQLAGVLRQRIESGALAPGDPIPSETALEAEFDLARGTIRKAVAMLREEGVIVTTRGKGSYVADQSESSAGE